MAFSGIAFSVQEPYRIGVNFWKSGKIYDEAYEGIIDGLYLNKINYTIIEVLNADLNVEATKKNLQKLDSMNLDLIFSLSSKGTQIALGLDLKTPIVATVINKPQALGIANSDSKTNIVGTSYYIPIEKQLEMYLKLFPDTQVIGMIYDPNNPASIEIPLMEKACKDKNIKFISISATTVDELPKAAKKLLNQGVEMIVVPTNQLVYQNVQRILNYTNLCGVPVVATNKQGVENGALAALYADTYILGREAVQFAKSILNGEEITERFKYIDEYDTIINMNSAMKIEYSFPVDIVIGANIVLQ